MQLYFRRICIYTEEGCCQVPGAERKEYLKRTEGDFSSDRNIAYFNHGKVSMAVHGSQSN